MKKKIIAISALVVVVAIALLLVILRFNKTNDSPVATQDNIVDSSDTEDNNVSESTISENSEANDATEVSESTDSEESDDTSLLTPGKTVYFSDFEDGNVSDFTNRGPGDTTVISASTENAVSGSTSLLASGRSAGWNGPAFRLDTICEPNTEYFISASVMGRDHTYLTLSFQYTDSEGEVQYSNLVQGIAGTGWKSIENVKVSFTSDMTNVYVYIEGSDKDIFLDDFSIVEAPSVKADNDLVSIADVFKDDFMVGTALTPTSLSSKSVMSLVEKHFSGSITAGNEMKPDAVLDKAATLAYVAETGNDENPQVSFSSAKPLLDYCQENNIPMRVHTLVWHQQTPTWFFKESYQNDGEWVSKEKMIKRLENFIKNYFETLTTLYPDIDFYACDVVNEAWLDNGSCRQPGTQEEDSNYSPWVKVFGDNSFIEYAFTFARKYAPEGCKLYYNDFNEYINGKVGAIVQMAKSLQEKGLIDGIGMQSHLDVRTGKDAFPSVSMYRSALNRYTSLGLDVQITELDATIPANSGEQYYEAQAEYYKGIIDAIYAHKDNVSALIFWGVTDDGSWRASQQPCLFDSDYMAKPAYYSIVEGRTAIGN